MSQTLTVYGRGNVLSTGPIYPPIQLSPNLQHHLGLVGIYTCNSVRNIYPGNNKFYYDKNKEITIPSGSYEIDEINTYLKSQINKISGSGAAADNKRKSNFELRPNLNTLKCEIDTIYRVDFTKPGNIGSMLGFTPQILEPSADKIHTSDKDVEIIKVSNIFVETNITSGAYRNNAPCHSIFEFGLSVEPGYNLEKEPSHIIYFPINTSEIKEVTIKFVDHNNQLVDFSEDTYSSVRLELKSKPWF